MPALVERDRLQVEAAGLAVLGGGPWKAAVEEDVRFEDLAGACVHEEACGREHAVEIGPREKSEGAGIVVIERQSVRESSELEAHGGGRHVFPGAKCALDRPTELV